jgi:hypothetical protein
VPSKNFTFDAVNSGRPCDFQCGALQISMISLSKRQELIADRQIPEARNRFWILVFVPADRTQQT